MGQDVDAVGVQAHPDWADRLDGPVTSPSAQHSMAAPWTRRGDPPSLRRSEETVYVGTTYSPRMTSDEEEAAVPATVDTADVTEVLQDHPVRIGVLFGSTVRGTETPESDVDVAVAFEESLPSADRHRARIDLVVDLMETLGVNDVDVTDLDGVRPAVGVSALRTGAVLVGDPDRIDRLREAFESRTTDRTHDERMRALDELIDRLEEAV